MAYLLGGDFSKWNDSGTFDWQAYKNAGHHFAIFRLSSGTTIDQFTQREWVRAQVAGVLVGGYHYFYPSVSVHQQAATCRAAIPSAPDLGLWADIEQGFSSGALAISEDDFDVRPAQAGNVPPLFYQLLENLAPLQLESVSPQLETFCQILDEENLYHLTGIYSSKYLFEKFVGHNLPFYSSRPLWTAHWNKYIQDPLVPDSWDDGDPDTQDWDFWQVDNKTAYPGVPDSTCDLNRFRGSLEDLEAWAGIEPPLPGDLEERVAALEQEVITLNSTLSTHLNGHAAWLADVKERLDSIDQKLDEHINSLHGGGGDGVVPEVYQGKSKIWLTNPDGSYHSPPSPSGDYISNMTLVALGPQVTCWIYFAGGSGFDPHGGYWNFAIPDDFKPVRSTESGGASWYINDRGSGKNNEFVPGTARVAQYDAGKWGVRPRFSHGANGERAPIQTGPDMNAHPSFGGHPGRPRHRDKLELFLAWTR